jgi:hypothetical protein
MLKRTLLAICAVLAAFLLFAIWDSHNIEKRAESFLAEWDRIKLGDDPQQLRLISKQIGVRYTSQDCNATKCTYSFSFYNTWIHRLHLAPIRVFGGRVVVEDNKVVRKGLLFVEGNRLQVLASVSDVDCYPCKMAAKPFDVSIMGLHSNVTLTPASTAEQRAMSYQFNLNTLASLRPLRNEKELQPALMEYVDRQIQQGRF